MSRTSGHDGPDFYEQLGARIAGLRRTRAMSQEALGELAHVGVSHVAHIEVGSRRPTLDVLLRLATALEVPLWRLITEDRLSPDERTWDATARELAASVKGLSPDDLRALSYLATRLRAAPSTGVGAYRAPRHEMELRAAEARRGASAKRARTKRRRSP